MHNTVYRVTLNVYYLNFISASFQWGKKIVFANNNINDIERLSDDGNSKVGLISNVFKVGLN